MEFGILPVRTAMRTLLFTLAILCTPLILAEPLTLSKDGKTEYVIVLPAEPTAIEQTAAKELKEHLDAVTGADFRIVKELPVIPAQAGIQTGDISPVSLDPAFTGD